MVIATGLVLVVVAFGIYSATRVDRFYDHFVWQAAAFLEGQAAIRYPVESTTDHLGNWFFQDVLPVTSTDGVARGLIPFPPLPAVVLVPFVAMFGLATDDQAVFTALGALDVAICWWMLGRLRVRPTVRLGTTVFFAFGTVFWYTAQLTTTWYQAHVVAVGLALLAVGLAIEADPSAQDHASSPAGLAASPISAPQVTVSWRDRLAIDRRAFVIGLLLGLATTARLTAILAVPFFLLVGPGRSAWRRGWSVGLGATIPVAALLGYNLLSTGHVFHPAYDHLYQLEARAYAALDYRIEWAAEDPRYLPQNLAIMFLSTPEILPDRRRDTLGTMDVPLCTEPGARRGLFDIDCPLALPRDTGMSVLLTSPAFVLLLPALWGARRDRLAMGAALAVLLVTIGNLMHFSQGWVQFGYRFGNDSVPFALVLVALGFERVVDGRRRWAWALAVSLILVSIAVNWWGVTSGSALGW